LLSEQNLIVFGSISPQSRLLVDGIGIGVEDELEFGIFLYVIYAINSNENSKK